MPLPQVQKPSKNNNTSQAFNDVLKSFLTVLDKLFKDNPALVIISAFIFLISIFLIIRTINNTYTYSLAITFIFIFLSSCLYLKDKNFWNAIFTFSLGIFTAFAVAWNSSTFSIFLVSCIMLFIILLFFISIRAAANVEEKLTAATISYIGDIETNKKDLQEVVANITRQRRDKGGLLTTDAIYDAILFFAYHKVSKGHMITLITALNYMYTLTKVDSKALLTLLKNMYYLCKTKEALEANLIILQKYLLKARSTPSDIVQLLNEALHIAIENDIEFVSFTDTIDTYLSRGYAQTSIIEQLSRKFTKKTP